MSACALIPALSVYRTKSVMNCLNPSPAFLPARRLVAVAMFCLLLAAQAVAGDLDNTVKAALVEPKLKNPVVAVKVIRLGDTAARDQTLAARNADRPLIPASNLKLLTTAAAMKTLGKDFTYQTRLVYQPATGTLAVIADGDPSLGDVWLLREAGWDVDTVFRRWADELKSHRLSNIKRLVVDDSVFDEHFFHDSWPLDQFHKHYVPQVAGLNLNANCIDFELRNNGTGTVDYRTLPRTDYVHVTNTCRAGREDAVWLARQPGGNEIVLRGTTPSRLAGPYRVTIHDPSMYGVTVLAETLRDEGISVGAVDRDRTIVANRGQDWVELAVHRTPLQTVVTWCNKASSNLYAEALVKRMAFARTGKPGTWADGLEVSRGYLRSLGVDLTNVKLDDGSGLSKENRVTADLLAAVLAERYHSDAREIFKHSLAVGGVDGTLEKRFDGDLQGRVLGKSGYVNGVSSLSGYLHGQDDQWYAFVILMNDVPPGANGIAKAVQERVVRAVNASLPARTAAAE